MYYCLGDDLLWRVSIFFTKIIGLHFLTKFLGRTDFQQNIHNDFIVQFSKKYEKNI